METIINSISALLSAVIGGAIAGFFALRAVSRSHALDRTAQSDLEQGISERVRTMLALEIEDNYLAFQKYDAGVDERILFDNGTHQPKERALQLSDTPLPVWKHHYWQELTSLIPNALTPAEIKKCHEFHSQLDELTRLRGFSRQPQGNWHLCVEQTIKRLKDLKNPLNSSE
jgi:hypothetical protein